MRTTGGMALWFRAGSLHGKRGGPDASIARRQGRESIRIRCSSVLFRNLPRAIRGRFIRAERARVLAWAGGGFTAASLLFAVPFLLVALLVAAFEIGAAAVTRNA